MNKKPKRILMTADTVGGVWCYALDLICKFQSHGTEVLLATMGAPAAAAQRQEFRALKNAELRESRFQLEWMDNPWRDVEKAGKWLLDLEEEFEPDIIHLNGYAHGILPWQAPSLVVGHSCVLSWWVAVKGEKAPGRYSHYQKTVRAGLTAADAVVVPTRAMLMALRENYEIERDAIVIPNGRPLGAYRPGAKENVVFSAGRLWDEAKNVAALCECSARLPWQVHLAGETQHPKGEFNEFANVRCLGRLSPKEMANWFSRAAIYALPAKYEPFGLSILEAALSGCALVLGDIPSLRENWDDAALFVPPEDSAAIEAALQELIAHPRVRENLTRRALARARHFNITATARSYLNCYSSLLKSRVQDPEHTLVSA